MRNKAMASSRSGKIKIIISVAVAVLLLLNVGLWFIPERFKKIDITANDAYTLSDGTKTFLSGLDEKITLYVLDADGSDTRYEYLLGLLDGYKNVDVKWMSSKKATHLLEPMGLTVPEDKKIPYFIVIESEKRTAYLDHYSLFSYVNSNSDLVSFISYIESMTGQDLATTNSSGYAEMSIEQYELLLDLISTYAQNDSQNAATYVSYYSSLIYDTQQYFYGEVALSKKIEEAIVDKIPTRYMLTGHGETPVGNTWLGFMLSEMGLQCKDLNTTESLEIPSDAVSVMVLAPTSDITEAEAQTLLNYLGGGGQITFITSDANLSMPNLMSVINAYGMSANSGTVGERVEVKNSTDESTVGPEAAPDPSAEPKYESTDSVTAYLNTDHDALSVLKNLSVVSKITKGNDIDISAKLEGIKTTALLTTSENCYIGEYSEEDSEMKHMILAAIAEKENGGKLLWFTGASSFLNTISSDTTEEQYVTMYGNCITVVSTAALAPLSYESTLTLPSARPYASKYLTVTDTNFVFSVIVVIVAVVAASVTGLIIWYRRKKA